MENILSYISRFSVHISRSRCCLKGQYDTHTTGDYGTLLYHGVKDSHPAMLEIMRLYGGLEQPGGWAWTGYGGKDDKININCQTNPTLGWDLKGKKWESDLGLVLFVGSFPVYEKSSIRETTTPLVLCG